MLFRSLTDAPLPKLIEKTRDRGVVASFLCVKPGYSFHLVQTDEDDLVREVQETTSSNLWINGGYFVFRQEIFDYIHDGEELVLEPFNRLIEAQALMAYKYEGFWRAMDTLRDREVLEEMVERGNMPWRLCPPRRHAVAPFQAEIAARVTP